MNCKKCLQSKKKTEFYVTNKSVCKRCISSRSAEWSKDNPERRRQLAIKTRLKNKEKIRAYYRDWYAKNGRKRDKRKQHAHALVYAAVKYGRIIRPSECSRCSRTEKIEAHHDDYYKPLEVQWLCNRCHRKLHPGA